MFFDKLKRIKKYDPEAERKLRREIEEAGGLEKNDLKAMIMAALLVIMPIVLIIFSLFVVFILLFL